ncbi:MAG: hypothetical protein F6J97_16105 [Leptolyngbya sp. SIO4C1]|nr:hypothetical protein [Leptolyngbya sp. SIO4C1]
MDYPTTPDGRYFVVKGRLWRCTNPALEESTRQALVKQLMAARRAVKTAQQQDNEIALKAARERVHQGFVAQIGL